jgi:hypothetical protein
MTGMSCLVDGERWCRVNSGPGVVFYRRGRVRKLVHAQQSLVGAELVLEWEFLFKGGAVIGSFSSEPWG